MARLVGGETKRKGDTAEAYVLAGLVSTGLTVLKPWGDNARYDLVVDCHGRFIRIQCKTGRLRNGCVVFRTYGVGRDRSKVTHYTPEDIDYYGVWCLETQATYLLPVREVTSWSPYLRIEPARPAHRLNSAGTAQVRRIRWAQQYELAHVVAAWLAGAQPVQDRQDHTSA